MSETLTPDVCVVGAGAGGTAAALTAVRHGASVVLIEKADAAGMAAQGGMPAARAAAAVAASVRQINTARRFGISVSAPTVPQLAVVERLNDTLRRMLATVAPERWAGLGVPLIRAAASFRDPATLVAGDTVIKPRHIVLAPGSAPIVPPINGLATVPYVTPETIWSLTLRPDHLAVLGGGPYALDLAQTFLRLGSRVMLLTETRALPDWDAELADPLIEALRDEGLVIVEGVSIEKVERASADGIRLAVSAGGARQEILDATHLLLALGGCPRLDGLGLQAAGISFDQTGILAARDGQTENRAVMVVGDARARSGHGRMPPSGAQGARAEGQWIAQRLAGVGRGRYDEHTVPRIVPTDPGLAVVGLDEDTARRRYGAGLRITRWPFSETDAAIADRRDVGFVKVIAAPDGTLLGASVLGHHAGELIQPWALAISAGIDLARFADASPGYGLLAAANREAAACQPVPRRDLPLIKAANRLAFRR